MPKCDANLKPCPFCGGQAVIEKTTKCLWVACKRCAASIKICSNSESGEIEAMAAWNVRVCESGRATKPLDCEGVDSRGGVGKVGL